MAIALLGVLKSGAAYVAIDPKCPPERTQYIMQETKSPLHITDECFKNLESVLNTQEAVQDRF